MKAIGSLPRVLCLLLLCCAAGSHAEIKALIDRNSVSLGDVLRLTIVATGDEELSELDLRPLNSDFDVIQRSTSSSTRIVNGKRTHQRQLLIDMAPRREGSLNIPSMRTGQHVTNKLTVTVGPMPEANAEGQNVIFEAELDRTSAYVQGQVILTLRLQQAINLDGRSISELQLDNAYVKPLEQQSFQRQRNGKPWLVHEVRYAIFPEQSGKLVIPAQSFTARESQPRRSLFDVNDNGRLVRRATQPLVIDVLSRPAQYPDSTWLPARKVTLEESWSTPPAQLRAGESATRTIRIVGEGLQGAQLPPVQMQANEGLKYYPDQPAISESEVASGVLGSRQDSAAVVPTREGNWTIPEVRIPWWDTEHEELRYAIVPQRDISVAPADLSQIAPEQSAASTPAATAVDITPPNAAAMLPWQIVSVVSTLGWLLTLGYMLRSRRPAAVNHPEREQSEAPAFKKLQTACSSGNAAAARAALIGWTAAMFPERGICSLEQVASEFNNEELEQEVRLLNSGLYSSTQGSWSGTALAKVCARLRKQHNKAARRHNDELTLYPQATSQSPG